MEIYKWFVKISQSTILCSCEYGMQTLEIPKQKLKKKIQQCQRKDLWKTFFDQQTLCFIVCVCEIQFTFTHKKNNMY